MKALGVKVGAPWHHLRDLSREHSITGLNSSYTLYGDMSRRVMTILGDMAARQEVYSIDECFLDCAGMRGLFEHGPVIRKRIQMWTGLPACVGFAPKNPGEAREPLREEITRRCRGCVRLPCPATICRRCSNASRSARSGESDLGSA